MCTSAGEDCGPVEYKAPAFRQPECEEVRLGVVRIGTWYNLFWIQVVTKPPSQGCLNLKKFSPTFDVSTTTV
jgi:hypothetical protein